MAPDLDSDHLCDGSNHIDVGVSPNVSFPPLELWRFWISCRYNIMQYFAHLNKLCIYGSQNSVFASLSVNYAVKS